MDRIHYAVNGQTVFLKRIDQNKIGLFSDKTSVEPYASIPIPEPYQGFKMRWGKRGFLERKYYHTLGSIIQNDQTVRDQIAASVMS